MNNLDNSEPIEEGLGDVIRLGTLLALLSVPNILNAKELKAEVKSSSQITATAVKTAISKTPAAKEKCGDYTMVQAANILARTLYMEARSEGTTGIDAVASVIWNRANKTVDNVPGVCLKKKQFSCWNSISDKDPKNYNVVIPSETTKPGKNRDMWLHCQYIAGQMLKNKFESTIGNRNAYHTTAVTPSWDASMTNKKTIGKHVFGYLSEYDKQKAEKTNVYKVKNGDNLGKIAKANNTTVKKLIELNPFLKKNPDKIVPGMKLKLPS